MNSQGLCRVRNQTSNILFYHDCDGLDQITLSRWSCDVHSQNTITIVTP